MLILNSPYDLPDVNATMENSSEIQIKSIQDTDTDEFGVHTLYLETNGTAYTRTGNEQKDCVIQVVSRNDIGLYNQKLQELASRAKRQTNRALKKQAWSDFWEYKGRYADIDFGYAITAHKSQGSTYDIVVVDEKDIMGTTATSNQEKSELIYTALTRPRKTAIVISSVPVSNPYTGDIENPSLPKQQNERKIDYHPGNWTRQEVNDNPDVLYVFGDNTNRTSGRNPISNDSKYARTYGLGKMFPNATAAIIRGMDNAMPVSTQHWYDPTTGRTRDAGRWNDSDIEDFKKVIDAEFQAIKDEWDTGKYRKIYLPSTGLSNGKISQITETRTPVLFKYLYDKTADLAKYVSTEHNDTHNVSYEQAQKTISSPNTILTNEEILALHPFTGSDTHPRIAVASEKTDPAFFAKQLEDFFSGKTTVKDYRGNTLTANDMDAMYIITKHDGLPMRRILSIQKPKIIHFSITTLGDTKWEPGVMKWQDMIERVGKFIKQGLDPKMVTLRIDPIIPGVTKIKDVEALIKRASELGITNVKFSVMDYYRTTSIFMKNLGYDYEKNGYEKLPDGNFKPNAKPEIVKGVSEKMLQIANKYGVKLSTCAEPGVIPGISKQGCLSVQQINNILGTHIEDKAEANNKQRQLCTCYGGKVDILRYNSNCASSCMYCYAHHNGDKMLNYYNEDGTLKYNVFTRSNPNDYSDSFQNTHSDDVVVEDVVKPWKSDSSKQNKSRRIYLKGKENKGYFEVVKDLEDNNYSVHFKPTDSKNPDAFTQEEKTILFQAVADIIPYGANLSTWGELSKGGIHGLNRFANLGFTKTGEKAAKTKSGEDINIPIFTKQSNNTETKLTKPESLKNFEEDVIDGDKVLRYSEKNRFGSTGYAIKYKNGKYFITKTDWGDYFWHEANEFELRALEPRSSLNFSTFSTLKKDESEITLKDYLKYIATNSNDINIYAGTNENADLSNFAIRPFTHHFNDGSVKEFQSVEQAFQYIKASGFADTRSNDGNTRSSGKSIQAEIMGTTSGLELRSLGRQVKNLNVQAWDRSSSFIMKQLLKESFEQNPQALQRLLDTGNATLTHVQDEGKWGKEFPKLLMEVREELKKKQDSYKVKNDQDIKDDLKELGKRRQDDCNK